MTTRAQLIAWVRDARRRTCELVADLADAQLRVPRWATVNPFLWELGHVAWFQEKWLLRHMAKEPPIRADGDALYDSAAISHDTRWELPLPSREETLRFLAEVRDRVVQRLEQAEPSEQDVYFTLLSVFHEDMHAEAFTYMRQTLGYPAPALGEKRRGTAADSCLLPPDSCAGPWPGEAEIPGGIFQLGAEPGESFVFDNEKWAHPVEIRPFAIARAAVTQGEFAAFVDAGGYREQRFWSEDGWRWREEQAAEHPLYWRREGPGRWLHRQFDRWIAAEPHRPVVHVNWHEAEAYCRWAGRRLPTEGEWEAAAAAEPHTARSGLAGPKRRYPWGVEFPSPRHANLDWRSPGCLEVAELRDGDSAFGCRQMLGNVWEWTASDFGPYPGFTVDPYKEYSAPWFGSRKVLRGGSWATTSRLLRNTWRNFYSPDRRDPFAGFRTCALAP